MTGRFMTRGKGQGRKVIPISDKRPVAMMPRAFMTEDMSIMDAEKILGDRADWELRAMKKALTTMPLLNTPEENQRLQAVKVMLRSRRQAKS